MTDRLDEIRARLDGATPGPWDFSPVNGVHKGHECMTITCGGKQRSNAEFIAAAELIAAAPGDISFLLGEVERLRAENQKYRDDYEVTVSNDLLTVGGDGKVTLTFHGAREIMLRMGESLAQMLDEYDATNYLELEARRADGKKFILRVERYGHPKPHDLRLAAEAERDRLLALLDPDNEAVEDLVNEAINSYYRKLPRGVSIGYLVLTALRDSRSFIPQTGDQA